MIWLGHDNCCLKEKTMQDFPGGPVVKTLLSHCRGHRFNPWLGNEYTTCQAMQEKKKKSLKEKTALSVLIQ